MRIDKFLFEKGFAESRMKAQAMIIGGNCRVNGKTVTKPSFDVNEDDNVEIVGETLKYVSRGGLKLEAALEYFNINANDRVCADIGASTGGFTDCLLMSGASKVFAVDCGQSQLHPKLLSDARVVNIEKFNAKELTRDTLGILVDIVVMDVSFISQTSLHRAVSYVLKDGGVYISLIKPQFEAGRSKIGKGGIVKDASVYKDVKEKVVSSAKANGLSLVGIIGSPIKGGDGNTEFIGCFIKDNKGIDNEICCNFPQ